MGGRLIRHCDQLLVEPRSSSGRTLVCTDEVNPNRFYVEVRVFGDSSRVCCVCDDIGLLINKVCRTSCGEMSSGRFVPDQTGCGMRRKREGLRATTLAKSHLCMSEIEDRIL